MTDILRRLPMKRLVARGIAAAFLLLPGCAASPTGAAEEAAAAAAAPLAPSPLGHYLAGRHAQKLRDLGRAAELMGFALAEDPENPELLQGTYVLLASEGEMAAAARLADRLEAAGIRAPTAPLTLALDALKRGDLAAAEARLAAMPSNGLNDIYLPLIRAWVALEREGPEAALAALQRLAGTSGVGTLYHLHRGLVEDRAGRAEAAAQAYDDMLAAASQPSFRLVEIAANFHLRQGRREKARALYDDFAEADQANLLLEPLHAALAPGAAPPAPAVASLREGVAEALFNTATVLHQENATDMALLFTRMALDLRPGLPIAQVLLGDILTQQGRLEAAIAAYGAVDPGSTFGWQARLAQARNLDELGRTEEAVALLEGMIEERPERWDAATQLGNILRAKERFAEAAAAYDVAVERIPALKPQHWTLLYFRGIAHERSKNWPAAEADFLKALELEPDQPFVLNYLAYSWVEQGQNYDRALEMLEKAVSLRPRDGYIVDSLGWVLYRLGRYQQAVEQLERAILLKPDDPVINDHLGDAYWKVGRKTEARYQWRRALSYEPEADQVGLIETKIERGLAHGPSGS